ncbi:hypothetical protein M3Y99_01279800 [Aphelenchoides fujianensis]|nr:hypothetical protein M3Y99_01279800 [Aphelenchoides fujianensis]
MDPFTLVVLMERHWDQLSLYLIRLAADSKEYKPRLLHSFSNGLTTVGLRLAVGSGEERRAILARTNALYARGDTITFVRLNVAEAWAEVEHTTAVPFHDPRAFQWSNDGRERKEHPPRRLVGRF